MTLSEIDEHVDQCADVETISPLACWEAMAVPTVTTIPWAAGWRSLKSLFSRTFQIVWH